MILYQQGNLLSSTAQALVIPVYTVSVDTKYATEVKKKYPNEFREFEKQVSFGLFTVGEVTSIPLGFKPEKDAHSRHIVFFPISSTPQETCDVGVMSAGMLALVRHCEEREIESIAMPYLGVDQGLPISEFRRLVTSALSECDMDVIIYS